MDYELFDFKNTLVGIKVGLVLTRPDNVQRMMEASEAGVPAVQVVGRALLEIDDSLSSSEAKILVGRWVREIMTNAGWVPSGVKGVATGNLFSNGVVFVLNGGSAERPLAVVSTA